MRTRKEIIESLKEIEKNSSQVILNNAIQIAKVEIALDMRQLLAKICASKCYFVPQEIEEIAFE